MTKYKVLMIYESGEEEDDMVFDTYDEAYDWGLECCSAYHLGGEILELSNPGDYPYDEDEEVDFEVIEVEE